MALENTLIKELQEADVGAIVLAIGAIGTTSFSLVDALKVLEKYGPSASGYRYIHEVYLEMAPALETALGRGWNDVLRGYWLNGTPRDRQIAAVMGAMRLGLTANTVGCLTKDAPVEKGVLETVVRYLNDGTMNDPAPGEEAGAEQSAEEVNRAANALGRLDAYFRTRLDAAFERADHRYRNVSRVWAGVIAVGLSVCGGMTLTESVKDFVTNLPYFIGIGLIAVPLAPIAKDLASSLATVTANLKTLMQRG